jgi:pimeloyl-ACP methyl ester carboxylesterase
MDPSTPPQEWTELNSALMYAPGNEHLATARGRARHFSTVARAQVEASNSTPPEDWVSGGAAPTLVIVGLRDRVAIPANGLEIATTRAKTWLLGIRDCGQSMVDEQPEILTREIAEFINRNSS